MSTFSVITPLHEPGNRYIEPYIEAHLFAIKDGYRPMGELCW
jgi:hypothetical protein